ncbi:RagB/SusD family nutrient uptake outer membrane protein [Mariniflexile ostreae]|uniref:RagB/SusD family nutrient uptake outer membrane protein n=1 Tax=Mariniflexile ostreae TaxID=1520892 RepID=A0ABV5FBS2_9FLAO
MKHTYKISIIMIFLMFFATLGCSDFLEEDLRDKVTIDNFFNSDAEAVLAVNGLYRVIHSLELYRTSNNGLDDMYMFGADLVGANRAENLEVHNYTFNESSTDPYGTWKKLYELARNAALFLENIDGNEKLSLEMRNQAVGEILFFRALAYYHLTNIWGDVPYFRTLPTIVELSSLPRTDKVIIRKDLKKDLEKAIGLLPSSYSGSDLGRVTKWAAATLKTKLHLFDKEWKAARDEAAMIINNSPHRLLDNYADVFDQSDPFNQYNDEHIFVIDYSGSDAVEDELRQNRTDFFNPRLRDEPKDPSQKAALIAALKTNNDNMTGYGKAIPLPEFADRTNWQVGDLRYDASITTNYEGIELNFPYFRKLWNLDQEYSRRANHPDNVVVFRLADVYLMAAEAENELNGPGDAYQYINKVRERAFEPDQPLSGMTQETFREQIRDERKFELSGESHRRMDLIRWGILVETVRNVVHRPFNNPGNNIQAKHVLYPIPAEEILLNPALLEGDPSNNGYR